MSTYTIVKYQAQLATTWNNFIASAKNATFLFHRDFMDYHSDRFKDHSLLIFKDNKVVAVLPANIKDGMLYSHQGLTYGGLVLGKTLKFKEAFDVFKCLLKFLATQGIDRLQLKLIPKIYREQPSDEIDYLLFLVKAELSRCDLSSTIFLPEAIKIQGNRMEGIKKAQQQKLEIREEAVFKPFWDTLLIPNLKEKHGVKPVHSASEIVLLAKRFPENIKQFNVYKDNVIVAGTTLFETQTVAHLQYISANKERQQLGSLDFLLNDLIGEKYADKAYFDFGISNENHGLHLNEGLLYWKESFGARSTAYQFYEVNTANHRLLNSVFI